MVPPLSKNNNNTIQRLTSILYSYLYFTCILYSYLYFTCILYSYLYFTCILYSYLYFTCILYSYLYFILSIGYEIGKLVANPLGIGLEGLQFHHWGPVVVLVPGKPNPGLVVPDGGEGGTGQQPPHFDGSGCGEGRREPERASWNFRGENIRIIVFKVI